MAVAPSFQDLLNVGQAEAQARRPDLAFAEGDITVAQLHGDAAMADAAVRYAAQGVKETYIDGASGDALTALVDDHLNIQRNEATAAQVTLKFTRTSSGAGGTIAAGTQVSTAPDAQGVQVVFTTDGALIFGGGANGPLTVAATATNVGSGGNVSAGSIIQIVSSLFDTTFSVTNDAAAAGGNEDESDEALRERAHAFFPTLKAGTLAALEYGALQVASVRIARATEDPDTGLVTVSVSDSNGGSTQEMVADVREELDKNWRAAGAAVEVVGGSALVVDLDIILAVTRTGFDVAAMEATIITAVTARINKLKVGQTMYLDAIIASIIAVAPDDIEDVSFATITVGGSGQSVLNDVVPATGKILRAGTITVA